MFFTLALHLVFGANDTRAWGPEGHRIIGYAALQMADEEAAAAVRSILAADSDPAAREALDQACNWPDVMRDTAEWKWSSPLHYVNVPRSERHYERERDCPEGLCVTEGIKRYANELTLPGPDPARRWQALAWLCHLVGDLHQPLHAGFRDDRGGNRVIVQFRGQSVNLHQFWDRSVVRAFLGEGDTWSNPLAARRWTRAGRIWKPAEAPAWTDESHGLALTWAYPPDPVISAEFAERSWLVTREQWQKAAVRLARMLNALLGEGEVVDPEG
ncbi:MAG: S1/P1 nuclease [Gammaproteobacteria bacterium]|nr:S1/P1 nuclease [Gammaproteobacteria bacterium]